MKEKHQVNERCVPDSGREVGEDKKINAMLYICHNISLQRQTFDKVYVQQRIFSNLVTKNPFVHHQSLSFVHH